MAALSAEEQKAYDAEQALLARVVQGLTATDSYSSGRGRG